jgi:endonuclease YncB( thermonuclease family)
LAFRFRQLRKSVHFNQADVATALSPIARVFREMLRALARLSLPVKFFSGFASARFWGPAAHTAQARLSPFWAAVISLSRATVRELAGLRLSVKILIGAAILIEFVVITQWERLPFHSASAPPAQIAAARTPAPSPLPTQSAPTAERDQAPASEATPLINMPPIVIEEPMVGQNGSITAKGQVLFLYGIKQIDSKKVCTKPSGEKWACGLYSYATLRNSIAHNKIVCEPKAPLTNGLAATCRMGPTNVATILLREGLAEVESGINDQELADAQAFAKVRKLGIWDR